MDNAKELYLDLLKKALTFYLWEDRAAAKLLFEPQNPIKKAILRKTEMFFFKMAETVEKNDRKNTEYFLLPLTLQGSGRREEGLPRSHPVLTGGKEG